MPYFQQRQSTQGMTSSTKHNVMQCHQRRTEPQTQQQRQQQQQQHPFNGTTRVSQYQKGKTSLDLMEQETVSGSGVRRAICKRAPRHGKFGHAVFELCEQTDTQTHRQTDIFIIILHNPTGAR